MIVASLLLILGAVTLLVLGLADGSSPLLVGSIAASLLAAIALVIGARQAAAARAAADGYPDDQFDEVAGGGFDGGDGGEEPYPRRGGSYPEGAYAGGPPVMARAGVAHPGMAPAGVGQPGVSRSGVPEVPDQRGGGLRSATTEAMTESIPVMGSGMADPDLDDDPGLDRRDPGFDRHAGSDYHATPPNGMASVHADLPDPVRHPDDDDVEDDDDPPDEPAPQIVPPSDAARVARMSTDVLVIDGRPRYHLPGCVHLLGRESEPLPVGEAVELGFTPCSLCEPDSALLADARRV